jgi:hypothetical protein
MVSIIVAARNLWLRSVWWLRSPERGMVAAFARTWDSSFPYWESSTLPRQFKSKWRMHRRGVEVLARVMGRNQHSNSSESRLRFFLAQRLDPSFTTGTFSIAQSQEPLQGLCFLALAVRATGALLTGMPINGHAKKGLARSAPVVNDGPTPPAAVKGHKCPSYKIHAARANPNC